MATTVFGLPQARAKLIPTAQEIDDAPAATRTLFIKVFSGARLSTSAPSGELLREERLYDCYHPANAADTKTATILIAKVLASVAADTDANYLEVDEAYAGLPISIVQRWFAAQKVDLPDQEGRLLRYQFFQLARDYFFNPKSKTQILDILAKRKAGRLAAVAKLAAAARSAPSADSLMGSSLFEDIFDSVFASPQAFSLRSH